VGHSEIAVEVAGVADDCKPVGADRDRGTQARVLCAVHRGEDIAASWLVPGR
jgi:hypothetical protein